MNLNRPHAGSRPGPAAPEAARLDPRLAALISRTLSQPAQVSIPDTFASRTARLAISQPPTRSSRGIGWGPRVALGSGAVITAAMFVLAPHAAPSLSNFRFDAELILLAELSGLLLFSYRLFSQD